MYVSRELMCRAIDSISCDITGKNYRCTTSAEYGETPKCTACSVRDKLQAILKGDSNEN